MILTPKETILIGGGDYRKQENTIIDLYLSKRISPEMKILILPFASPQKTWASWFSALFKNFEKYGWYNFEMLDPDLPSGILTSKIESADILFFTEGLPDILLKLIKEKGLAETIIQHQGLVIGQGASALALCRECIITPNKDYPTALLLEGLNLVSFAVAVHYEESMNPLLMELSRKRKIYALPDKSAIVYKENLTSFIGEVFCFQDGKREVMPPTVRQ